MKVDSAADLKLGNGSRKIMVSRIQILPVPKIIEFDRDPDP
jgi:hypothetical protein